MSSTTASGTCAGRLPTRCPPTIRLSTRCGPCAHCTTPGCGSPRASCWSASCASAICSGTTTQASPRLGGVQVLFPPSGGYEVSLAKRAHTDAFELHQAFDEQMSFHEKLRLLYVACTRARDHLVVSVHRAERANTPEQSRL